MSYERKDEEGTEVQVVRVESDPFAAGLRRGKASAASIIDKALSFDGSDNNLHIIGNLSGIGAFAACYAHADWLRKVGEVELADIDAGFCRKVELMLIGKGGQRVKAALEAAKVQLAAEHEIEKSRARRLV